MESCLLRHWSDMFAKLFLNSLRISCSLMTKAAVLISLFFPCFASDSPNTLSDFNSVKPDIPESLERLTVASLLPDPLPDLPNNELTLATNNSLFNGARRQGVDWGGIVAQSAAFILVEQGYRLGTQPGTREALKGEFFDDWFKSVKSTKGWGDGDDFLTNYIGHPMQGSVVGNIFVQNDPRGRNQVFGWNSGYWNSRLKATAWSAFYSTQFELGPISEASIGNVGHYGGSLSGYVDLVVTPLAGLGWQVGEDALDKYLIVRIETWTSNQVILKLARSFLNPTRSFANMMRMATPWSRSTRP
jgi:hypothetical protein